MTRLSLRKAISVALFVLAAPVDHALVAQEQVELRLLHGGEVIQSVHVDSTTQRIRNFKLHLTVGDSDDVRRIRHNGPLTGIIGLSELEELQHLSLIYTLDDVSTLEFIDSQSLEVLHLSSGFAIRDFSFLKDLPNLRVLGLNLGELGHLSDIEVANTRLEYLEISDAELTVIDTVSIPATLQYFNLGQNPLEQVSESVCEVLERNHVILIADDISDCGSETWTTRQSWRQLPEEFTMDRP